MPVRPLALRSSPLHLWLLPLALLTGCGTAKIDIVDTGPTADDSGDTDVTDDTDSGDTGIVTDGAISVTPASLDYGIVFVGESAVLEVQVTNVGDGEVALAAALDGPNAPEITLSTLDSPAPGDTATLAVTFTPAAWGDATATLTVSDTLGDGVVTIPVSASVQEDVDGDGYGSLASGGEDCDDTNAAAYPGATEIWYDGIDQDCLGGNDYDRDGDGAEYTVDCDDADGSVYPGAEETWYDGVDSDCAGDDDFDQDADGYAVGVDCDDTDATVNPAASEVWYDGVDQDCDGRDDDQDGDGYGIADDCNDLDASVNPGATETWYDGVDQDCSGGSDYDQDGDGVDNDTDCNDTDPTTTGPTPEVIDGVDNDCNGTIDDLSISDLASGVLYGGSSSLGLGDSDGLALGGDLTGDGVDDVVVSTDGSGSGYAFVVSGTTAATANGNVDSYDTAVITGASSYYPMGNLSGRMVDVSGDGTAELLIGGVSTSSYYGYGYGWVLTGGSALSGSLSVSTTYRARFEGDSSSDSLGWIAGGDVDGDGVNDIVAGAPTDNYSSGYYGYDASTGNVSVYSGTISGTYDIDESDDQIHGADDYDYLGYSILVADLDDDGYDDILAGAYGNDDGASNAGVVYVFPGNASMSWDSRADDAADVQIFGSSSSSYVGGYPFAVPGDVDGDGTLDLAFASPAAGSAWLFWDASSLSGSLSVSSADVRITGSTSSFGTSLAYGSDLDGDGATELWVGDPGNDTAASNAGAVWMFAPAAGSSGAWTTADASAMLVGAASGDGLGSGLAAGGDADGDGSNDLLVGATGSDGVASNGGAVYVVLGW